MPRHAVRTSFKKGCKPGPGRPKGSVGGRLTALARLDVMLNKAKNLKRLDRFLQKAFDKDPIKFFKDFVMPLVPRNQIITVEGAEKLPVRILFPDKKKVKHVTAKVQ